MSVSIDSLARIWITAGYSELWGCDGTYCPVAYDQVPVLKDIDTDFSWLADYSQGSFDAYLAVESNELYHLDDLVKQATELKLELPAEFLSFISKPELHTQVPTCTDCYLDLSKALFSLPTNEPCYALRFMNDSQACILWYLLLQPSKPAKVIGSVDFLDPEIFYESEDLASSARAEYRTAFEGSLVCADSFIEFIYRFWLENTLWFGLNEGRPLTSREAAYKLAAQANREI